MFELRPGISRENLHDEIKTTCEVIVLNNLFMVVMSSDGLGRFSVKSLFFWYMKYIFHNLLKGAYKFEPNISALHLYDYKRFLECSRRVFGGLPLQQ